MGKKKKYRKLRAAVAGIGMAALLVSPANIALADPNYGAILGGILATNNVYNVYLSNFISMGNDPEQQKKLLDSDMQKSGQDLDEADNAVVASVMEQLINHGEYGLPATNLPFRWRVNNSDEFNASCSAMDYVSVNRGLLQGINNNRDELAGVLGHEMIHGLHQHLQHDLAKTVATRYGASLLGQGQGALGTSLINILVNYNQAKNYTAPSENDADESGFYLMASAGFNPGGFAAMITKMPDSPSESILNPDDHPETSNRLKRALEWMQTYSCGHVTVPTAANGETSIMVDGNCLLSFKPVSEAERGGDVYSAREHAYFVAGGLSKAFHDNRLGAMWDFQQHQDGTVDFLDDKEAYAPLKQAVQENSLGSTLEKMVTAAYAADAKSGARDRMLAAEQERKDKIVRVQSDAKASTNENIDTYKYKCDEYNKLKLPKLAMHEESRLLACNPDNKGVSWAHAEKGWSYHQLGEYDKALSECNLAVQEDPGHAWNYLRRAKTRKALGDDDGALQDCSTVEKLAPGKYIDVHVVAGQIYDSRGDETAAMNEFNRALNISSRAMEDIPDKYKQLIQDQKERIGQQYNN